MKKKKKRKLMLGLIYKITRTIGVIYYIVGFGALSCERKYGF